MKYVLAFAVLALLWGAPDAAASPGERSKMMAAERAEQKKRLLEKSDPSSAGALPSAANSPSSGASGRIGDETGAMTAPPDSSQIPGDPLPSEVPPAMRETLPGPAMTQPPMLPRTPNQTQPLPAQDPAAAAAAPAAPADPCSAYMGSYNAYVYCQDRIAKLKRMEEGRQKRKEAYAPKPAPAPAPTPAAGTAQAGAAATAAGTATPQLQQVDPAAIEKALKEIQKSLKPTTQPPAKYK